MHLRCTVQLTLLVVRYLRFTQALIPLQLVRQTLIRETSTTYGSASRQARTPFRACPAHLSGSRPAHVSRLGPRTFRAEGFRPFQGRLRGAYTLFRAEALAPFQARPRGACAPCRAGLVRPAGRGLCALPGGACTPYRAGLVRPAGRGLYALPGGACAPCRAETVRPAGRGLCALPGGDCAPCRAGPRGPAHLSGAEPVRPLCGARSPFRTGPAQHHARDAYPAVRPRHFFRNTCGLSTSETSACAAFCHASFTMPKTFSLRGGR